MKEGKKGVGVAIPHATIRRLMKKFTNKKVSSDAVEKMIEETVRMISDVTAEAEKDEGTKTIMSYQIEPSIRRVRNKQLAEVISPVVDDAARVADRLKHLNEILRY